MNMNIFIKILYLSIYFLFLNQFENKQSDCLTTLIADATNHTEMCAIENYHIKSAPAFIEEKSETCMLTDWTWLDGISMQSSPKGN